MSILIRNMEMPTYDGVFPCRLRVENGVAKLEIDYIITAFMDERKIYPLVPVPPHGRLIDADAAKESLKPKDSISCYKTEWTWGELYERDSVKIDKLPTIIPAGK